MTEVRDLYTRGSEATVLLYDLLDLVYWVTSLKINRSLMNDVTWPESDRRDGSTLADKLSMPVLMRAWQVLSKGYEEVMRSPLPNQAVEMVLIRLAYLSDLPSAEDLLKLTSGGSSGGAMSTTRAAAPVRDSAPVQAATVSPITSFQDLLRFVAQAREPILYSHLMQDVHLVSFDVGTLVVRLGAKAPNTLPTQLETLLTRQTGQTWRVTTVSEGGAETVVAQNKKQAYEMEQAALDHPFIKEMMAQFPGLVAKVDRQETIH